MVSDLLRNYIAGKPTRVEHWFDLNGRVLISKKDREKEKITKRRLVFYKCPHFKRHRVKVGGDKYYVHMDRALDKKKVCCLKSAAVKKIKRKQSEQPKAKKRPTQSC